MYRIHLPTFDDFVTTRLWPYQRRPLKGTVFVYVLLTLAIAFAVEGCKAYNHAPREDVPAVIKQDCQKLVEGQLVFTPNTTMHQGTPYTVSARLSRGADVNITKGLDGKGIVVENALVSCMVAMTLDAEEPNAFKIENLPAGRKDDQILLANSYTQWDWRVTPLKSGSLHLLLYVTPMIYVDQVGQGFKRFPQPARIITVSPDYMFAVKNFILTNWAVWGSILTAIVIPIFLWLMRKYKKQHDEKQEKEATAKKKIGF
jgi:hypothetical protein